ncbi:GAF domain-containing protein [Haladaptatus sp. ZSTT2]|uniref:GAF domain-containing protein n=1 Tax=Haladaptatus sp. ZSTT2 TaxID=3120515 RepID=UPI00300E81C9
MIASSVQRGVKQWAVSLVGLLFVLLSVGLLAFGDTNARPVEFLLPLLLAFSLVGFGVWLARFRLSPSRASWVAAWTVAGTGLLALMSVWTTYHSVTDGIPLTEALEQGLVHLTLGGISGAAVGFFDVRREEQRELAARVQQAVDATMDGVAVFDSDGRFISVNNAFLDLFGFDDKAELLGEEWQSMGLTAGDALYDTHVREIILNRGTWHGELEVKRRDGTVFPVEVTFNQADTGDTAVVVREITDRKDAESRVKLLQEATLSFGTEHDMDVIIESAMDVSQSIIDYPMAIFWSYDEDADKLVPTHASDSTLEMLDESGLSLDDAVVCAGMEQLRVFKSGETKLLENYQSVPTAQRFPLPLGSVLYAPIGNYGLIAIASREKKQLSQTNQYLVDILTRSLRTAFDRLSREQAIEDLQTEMRTMVKTTDEQRIAEIAMMTARDVLGFPISGIWLVDETETKLEPAACTTEAENVFTEYPTFTQGESLSWQAFATGTSYAFDDVSSVDGRFNPDTKMRSELIIPLGEYGVVNIGSVQPNAFDETDVSLAHILAANTETALGRAKHEADLERQNDRLEFLNSLLRHDILNGMVVIQSRAQLLADRLSGDEQRHAETIDRWCVTIIDLVRHVRAMLDVFAGSTPVELHPINLSRVLLNEVDRVQSTYPDIEFSVSVPDDVTVRANDLLSEVLGNVVSNAVEHNSSDDPSIDISVTTDDETATVRVADNGPGVPQAQKEAIFRRDETGHAKTSGTGFGLFFVDAMVSQYGGSIHVEDNDPTGAVFHLTFPLATVSSTA